MTSKITYADTVGRYTIYLKPVRRRGGILQLAPGQNQTGYGSKISTDYVLVFNGSKRQRRIYAICWSNAASHYVNVEGKALFLRGGFDRSEVKDLDSAAR